MGYSKKSELWTSDQAMQEVERYEEYRQATLTLLIKHNAQDLIPMLGLEDIYANSN
jgi:ethanolamine utilization microcompartment shell protein EutS